MTLAPQHAGLRPGEVDALLAAPEEGAPTVAAALREVDFPEAARLVGSRWPAEMGGLVKVRAGYDVEYGLSRGIGVGAPVVVLLTTPAGARPYVLDLWALAEHACASDAREATAAAPPRVRPCPMLAEIMEHC
ncbi:MAG: hypothetical protein JWM27_4715 [Gemmatimonadetes bacterium]|nr:hypothetical protein [Gemmatimonadota bacterium]